MSNITKKSTNTSNLVLFLTSDSRTEPTGLANFRFGLNVHLFSNINHTIYQPLVVIKLQTVPIRPCYIIMFLINDAIIRTALRLRLRNASQSRVFGPRPGQQGHSARGCGRRITILLIRDRVRCTRPPRNSTPFAVAAVHLLRTTRRLEWPRMARMASSWTTEHSDSLANGTVIKQRPCNNNNNRQ